MTPRDLVLSFTKAVEKLVSVAEAEAERLCSKSHLEPSDCRAAADIAQVLAALTRTPSKGEAPFDSALGVLTELAKQNSSSEEK